MQRFTIIISMVISLILSSCSSIFTANQPDIQQGNKISKNMISQLKLGMTQKQVQQIMQGQTILIDTFSPHQMIYLYTFRPSKGQTIEKKLILTFANNKLVHIDEKPSVTINK